MTDPNILAELERIAAAQGGLLRPADVIEAARNPRSPLHTHFEWDDRVAAREYRLWQARQLIRVTVQQIDLPASGQAPVRVWVSLSEDRKANGGGYRMVEAVLARSELRKQLLEDALKELEVFQQKYAHLEELATLHRVIRNLLSKRRARGWRRVA
jgi:hypothetical protein